MNFLARLLRRRTPPSQDADVLSSNGLTHYEVQKGLRLSVLEAALSNIHISIANSIVLTGFALMIGAGDFELGLITAMPFLAQFCQFIGAYIEERFGQRRPIVVIGAAIGRGVWVFVAMLPFIHSLDNIRLQLFLLILAISQISLGICSNAWTSWMSDLVPPRQRGSYFGFRNNMAALTGMIVTLVAGWIIDYYKGVNDEPMGYVVVIVMAIVAAMAGVIVLQNQPEPPKVRQSAFNFKTLFTLPFEHKRFRTFMFLAAAWALIVNIAAPFYNAFGLRDLQMSFTTLAFYTIVPSISSICTQQFVGRMQDRFGDRKVLIVSVIVIIFLPWGWIFSKPGWYVPLFIGQILAGIFWPGINQGLVNMVMDRAPVEGRGAYVAMYGALTGAAAMIASVLSGVMASMMGDNIISLGITTLNQYSFIFALSGMLRIVMLWVFIRKL
jgi:MFS family permease